jgi:ligand-binding sensor domain-containing protein/nitrogen-specific signal transduction histidine kinase
MKRRALTTLVLVALAACQLYAERHYFRRYTASDGLSQAVAQALHQDSTGYIWIGTQAGLNRYDGAAFTVYSLKDGLANDWINAIAEDRQGRIWVGTLEGVSVFDGKKFKNYGRTEGLGGRVDSIMATRDGRVWAGSPQGIRVFEAGRWSFLGVDQGLPSWKVTSLLEDPHGRVWVGTSGGLARLEGDRFFPFGTAELQGREISALAFDRDGRLWVGCPDQVRVYQENRLVATYDAKNGLSSLPVVALKADRGGTAWIGTPQGLGKIEEQKLTWLTGKQGLQYPDVRSLLEDREGLVWIGTYGGLFKFQGRAFTNYDSADGLGSDNVRPILRDGNGLLWVGTTGGLSRFDGRRWRNFTVADGLQDNHVIALMQCRKGRLWVGTRRGMNIFEGGKFIEERSLPGRRVVSIVQDASGTIWCAAQPTGIFRQSEGEFLAVEVPGQSFSNARMLLDRKGSLWVSGDHGLSRWDGKEWKTFTVEDGLKNNQPYFMCEDTKGRIWFGYHSSSGLSCFDGRAFHHYSTSDGLANDAVFSLGVDSLGRLWVGTARGVDRFDGERFTSFSVEEGFADSESNAGGFFADQDGSLWFGTMGGLSHYHPRHDMTGGAPPPVRLTDLRLGGRRYPHGAQPTVSHRENDLLARAIALTFANEKRLAFEYRLLGFEDDWQTLDGREIRFTNLRPGDYTLQVRSRKYGNEWSKPAETAFSIKPPFWGTWWFRIMSIVLVAGMFFGGYQVQIMRVRSRAELLEQAVEERTHQLREKTEELKKTTIELERSNDELQQFAYVASHDLQEPLRMISAYVQLLARRYKDKLDEDGHEFMKYVLEGANRMHVLINDLLTYSRVGTQAHDFAQTDCRAVVDQALSNLEVAATETQAKVTTGPLPVVQADSTQLLQLFQNLIGNAIKYRSPDRPPEVHVAARAQDGEWVFTVQDNGIGIDPKFYERIFVIFQRLHHRGDYSGTGIGLAVCKKIVERHGGRIWVESRPEQGSRFFFTMPKAQDGPGPARPATGGDAGGR